VDLVYSDGKVYVLNSLDDTVSVINVWSRRVVATIPVGNGASHIACNDYNVYVTNTLDDTVSAIRIATDKLVDTIPTDDGPNQIQASCDKVFVVCDGAHSLQVLITDGSVACKTSYSISLDAGVTPRIFGSWGPDLYVQGSGDDIFEIYAWTAAITRHVLPQAIGTPIGGDRYRIYTYNASALGGPGLYEVYLRTDATTGWAQLDPQAIRPYFHKYLSITTIWVPCWNNGDGSVWGIQTQDSSPSLFEGCRIHTGGAPTALVFCGNKAYVVDGRAGGNSVFVINVLDLAATRPMATITVGDFPCAVAVTSWP
jgi:YVTN family beta-propeller protein